MKKKKGEKEVGEKKKIKRKKELDWKKIKTFLWCRCSICMRVDRNGWYLQGGFVMIKEEFFVPGIKCECDWLVVALAKEIKR